MGARARDDLGLVGKILLVWLLLLAIVALVAIDAFAILQARSRTVDLAEDAASAAVKVLEDGGDEEAVKLAALEAIADTEEEARVRRIGVGRREVMVVVVTRADTLVLGLMPFFEDLTRLTVTESRSVNDR